MQLIIAAMENYSLNISSTRKPPITPLADVRLGILQSLRSSRMTWNIHRRSEASLARISTITLVLNSLKRFFQKSDFDAIRDMKRFQARNTIAQGNVSFSFCLSSTKLLQALPKSGTLLRHSSGFSCLTSLLHWVINVSRCLY